MQPESQETEVRETTTQNGNTTIRSQSVARSAGASSAVIARRVVWFIAGLICTLLALRFVFLLLGANREADFTDFIYTISEPFVAPFVGIFGTPSYGVAVFEISSLIAILVYTLVAWGIAKLLTINHPHQEG